ncbi:MAG: permease [Thermoflexales bacterium]|nr:permease [Thermoflexales bacterium]
MLAPWWLGEQGIAAVVLAGGDVSGVGDIGRFPGSCRPANAGVKVAWTPRQPALAVLAGVSMGLVFPVCECGVVPVMRRLYRKGLPLPASIA